MHEDMKLATGIDTANCLTCSNLGKDGDGPEYNGNWPICTEGKNERFPGSKGFPFKKEMPCWEPEFWFSMFSFMIKSGTEEERDAAYLAYRESIDSVDRHHAR